MAIEKSSITIAYAGTLGFSDNLNVQSSLLSAVKDWFWTYNHNSDYAKSRSAYPLFRTLAGLTKQERKAFHIHFWGNIDAQNAVLSKKLDIDEEVLIEGMKTKVETVKRLKEADVLYLPLELNTKHHKTLFIPGKLFEYLSLKKPILCFSQPNDTTEILQRSGLGIIIDPFDLDGGIAELKKLVSGETDVGNLRPNEDFIASLTYQKKAREVVDIINKTIRNE